MIASCRKSVTHMSSPQHAASVVAIPTASQLAIDRYVQSTQTSDATEPDTRVISGHCATTVVLLSHLQRHFRVIRADELCGHLKEPRITLSTTYIHVHVFELPGVGGGVERPNCFLNPPP